MDGNHTPNSARPARPVRWDGASHIAHGSAASDGSAPHVDDTAKAAAKAASRAKRVRIRRLGIGFVGLAAITVISAVLALFSLVAWQIPLAALVLAVVDLFVLRAVHAATPARTGGAAKTETAVAPASATRDDAVRAERGAVRKVASSRTSDAQRAKTDASVSMAAGAFESEPRGARANARRPEAGRATEDEPTQEIRIGESGAGRTRPAQGRGSSSVTWSPVPVPRPTYLDAPKAVPAEPEPLVVDASVRDKVEAPAQALSETEAKESAARQWVEEPGRRPEVEDAQPLTVNKTAAQVGRLDDVLQRRRAAGE